MMDEKWAKQQFTQLEPARNEKLYLNSKFYVVKTVVAIFRKYDVKNKKRVLSYKGNEEKTGYNFSFSISDVLRQNFSFLTQMVTYHAKTDQPIDIMN